MNSLRCAGYTVMMAEGEEQLQELVDVVATAGHGMGYWSKWRREEMMIIAKR